MYCFSVIGYYESWVDCLACHQVAPSDLPLSELTHINYAFAYIDPGTYQLVTMDPNIPNSLFQLTTDTKQYSTTGP
jgi:chitinase